MERCHEHLKITPENHMAVGALKLKGPGYYNSLTRAKAGKAPLRFETTMGHHSGGAMPIRDRAHPNRVYVFHWSGHKGDKYGGAQGCKSANQLHFARIENDNVFSQLNKVTDRKGGHGNPWRNTPAVVAHPTGGAMVLFNECESNAIHMTFIGKRAPATIKSKTPKLESDSQIKLNFNDSRSGSSLIKTKRLEGSGDESHDEFYELDGAKAILFKPK